MNELNLKSVGWASPTKKTDKINNLAIPFVFAKLTTCRKRGEKGRKFSCGFAALGSFLVRK